MKKLTREGSEREQARGERGRKILIIVNEEFEQRKEREIGGL
jgi:hypothetical protein